MYTPKHFTQEDLQEIHSFIKANSFGILITQHEGKPFGTHIPLELSGDGQKLLGHLAKANPQWKSFADNKEVLCIFNGPHTYISSSWYDHVNVPTWNYLVVHVYGAIRILDESEAYGSLKLLVDKYEQGSEHPVKIEKFSKEYLDANLKALVAFEINITSMQASYKLSQNRDAKNHQRIVEELEKKNDFHANEIAGEMKKHNPHK